MLNVAVIAQLACPATGFELSRHMLDQIGTRIQGDFLDSVLKCAIFATFISRVRENCQDVLN